MQNEQVAELLFQALETEKGGIQIYETALKCVVNDELERSGKSIWSRLGITSRSCSR
jgi:rubrerythrin